MLLNVAVLALATFSTAVSAQILAEFVPYKRTEAPAGGWSLSLQTCPSGVPKCGGQWCCPTGLTCIETGDADTAEVCCPGSINCLSAFQAAPACADDSWSLWNATTTTDDFGFFCCLLGQVGLADGTCVPANEATGNEIGLLLSAPTGSGSTAPTTSTSTSTSTSSASVATTATATVTTSSSASSKEASSSSSASSSASAETGSTSSSSGATSTGSGSGTSATSSGSSSSSSAAASSTAKSEGMRVYGQGVGVMALVFVAGLL